MNGVQSGIDRIAIADDWLRGKRLGLMTNPTGIDRSLTSTIDILNARYRLTALFACEHGVRGDIQAGAAVETMLDPDTGVTVYSTYGQSHRLSDEMLDAFDVFVFDMQDVGARFYTYLYSLAYAMEACDAAGKPVVVLDRINPLGGTIRAGTVIDPAFRSFVGDYGLPAQTGLTIGEFARYVHALLGLKMPLLVVPLSGWSRAMTLPETGLPWVAPSPNCATYAAARVFPGACPFEGTNLSEGRGTTQPFELIGAPWVRARELEQRMAAIAPPGVHFRRASFRPAFSKHAGALCHGVQWHVTDPGAMDACLCGLLLMDAIRELHPEDFAFLPGIEGGGYPIDRLLGTDAYRAGGLTGEALLAAHQSALKAFSEKVKPHLLY
jgi:uncharacterized protein YbbC (DUF1343 family)